MTGYVPQSSARRGFAEHFDGRDVGGFVHEEPEVAVSGDSVTVRVASVHPTECNHAVRNAVARGARHVFVRGANGQRFIAAGLEGADVEVEIEGVPGNDLAMLLDGPTVRVHGDAQDGVGNTMGSGTVVVEGRAGDVLGYAMRGGTILVRGDIGCRAGINMKEYGDEDPTIVVGGTARDFLGEYMAGGVIVVLGARGSAPGALVGDFLGAGMCAGSVYLRARAQDVVSDGVDRLEVADVDAASEPALVDAVGRFARAFGDDERVLLDHPFCRVRPRRASGAPIYAGL